MKSCERTFKSKLENHELTARFSNDELTLELLKITGNPERCVGRFTQDTLPRSIIKFFYDIQNLFIEIESGTVMSFSEEKRILMVEGVVQLKNRQVKQWCELPLQTIELDDRQLIKLLKEQNDRKQERIKYLQKRLQSGKINSEQPMKDQKRYEWVYKYEQQKNKVQQLQANNEQLRKYLGQVLSQDKVVEKDRQIVCEIKNASRQIMSIKQKIATLTITLLQNGLLSKDISKSQVKVTIKQNFSFAYLPSIQVLFITYTVYVDICFKIAKMQQYQWIFQVNMGKQLGANKRLQYLEQVTITQKYCIEIMISFVLFDHQCWSPLVENLNSLKFLSALKIIALDFIDSNNWTNRLKKSIKVKISRIAEE